jgi:hypothetical protein
MTSVRLARRRVLVGVVVTAVVGVAAGIVVTVVAGVATGVVVRCCGRR